MQEKSLVSAEEKLMRIGAEEQLYTLLSPIFLTLTGQGQANSLNLSQHLSLLLTPPFFNNKPEIKPSPDFLLQLKKLVTLPSRWQFLSS
jgi:hypothetical protein